MKVPNDEVYLFDASTVKSPYLTVSEKSATSVYTLIVINGDLAIK
jgi:hypothetical protein